MVTLSYYSAQHSTIKRESHMMVLSRFPPTPISSTLCPYTPFLFFLYLFRRLKRDMIVRMAQIWKSVEHYDQITYK